MAGWPDARGDLEELQRRLAAEEPEPWHLPADGRATIGAVFAAFSTRADPAPVERAWVVAVAGAVRSLFTCEVRAPYEPGYLALREGPALEEAVRVWTCLRTCCSWMPPGATIRGARASRCTSGRRWRCPPWA